MKDFVFGVIVDLNGFKASFSIDDLVSIGAFALVAVGLKGINLNHLNFLIMLQCHSKQSFVLERLTPFGQLYFLEDFIPQSNQFFLSILASTLLNFSLPQCLQSLYLFCFFFVNQKPDIVGEYPAHRSIESLNELHMFYFCFVADKRYLFIYYREFLLWLESRRHIDIVVFVIRNKISRLRIHAQRVRLGLFKKEEFSHIFTFIFSLLDWSLTLLDFATFIDPSISRSNCNQISFQIDFLFVKLFLERNCFWIKYAILRQHRRHNKKLIAKHLLLIIRKNRQLVLQFQLIAYIHGMLVVMSEQKSISVVATFHKNLPHNLLQPYPLPPIGNQFRIIAEVHCQIFQYSIPK